MQNCRYRRIASNSHLMQMLGEVFLIMNLPVHLPLQTYFHRLICIITDGSDMMQTSVGRYSSAGQSKVNTDHDAISGQKRNT